MKFNLIDVHVYIRAWWFDFNLCSLLKFPHIQMIMGQSINVGCTEESYSGFAAMPTFVESGPSDGQYFYLRWSYASCCKSSFIPRKAEDSFRVSMHQTVYDIACRLVSCLVDYLTFVYGLWIYISTPEEGGKFSTRREFHCVEMVLLHVDKRPLHYTLTFYGKCPSSLSLVLMTQPTSVSGMKLLLFFLQCYSVLICWWLITKSAPCMCELMIDNVLLSSSLRPRIHCLSN